MSPPSPENLSREPLPRVPDRSAPAAIRHCGSARLPFAATCTAATPSPGRASDRSCRAHTQQSLRINPCTLSSRVACARQGTRTRREGVRRSGRTSSADVARRAAPASDLPLSQAVVRSPATAAAAATLAAASTMLAAAAATRRLHGIALLLARNWRWHLLCFGRRCRRRRRFGRRRWCRRWRWRRRRRKRRYGWRSTHRSGQWGWHH